MMQNQIMKRAIIFCHILLAYSLLSEAQEISPYLFGQNHWMAKSDEGDRPGYIHLLWPKIQESGVKLIRIGGGGYEHRFPNRVTLKAIIDSIQGIGAEPLLQVPSHYSAEEASELVEFFNKDPKRKPIRFWSIGNEPLLRVRHDRESMLKKLDDVYAFLTRIAPAMKLADPTINILIYDGSGIPIGNTEKLNYEAYEALCGGRLDVTGKDENGHWMIDGINWHIYPNRQEYDRDDVVFSSIFSIRKAARQITELIEKANQKHGRNGDARLIWGLTEINVNAGNPNREVSGIGCPSFLGGQFIAEVYGIGMENGAYTVAPWCISETDRVRTDFGFIGLPADFYPRSSYYHTQLLALHMSGTFLHTESNMSYVHAIGSINDSEICVMILNRDQFHNYEFDLILNKDEKSEKPLIIRADVGLQKTISGSIPNQTTQMFVLSRSGEIKEEYNYGLTHNLKNLPPEKK